MRIALVSDIHGNLVALEAVVADIRRRGVDAIVNLGDSLSGPLLPLETAQFLMAQGWPTLAGNHERQLLTLSAGRRGLSDDYAHSRLSATQFEWLKSLPATLDLAPDVLLCHGTPSSDLEYFLETVEPATFRPATAPEIETRLGAASASLVACGHTHIARSVRAGGGRWIVNPGSVGLPAYDDDRPFPHVIQTGSPDARYAIVEKAAHGWIVSLLTVAYDHESMARLALQHGRREWAHALRTGYLPA